MISGFNNNSIKNINHTLSDFLDSILSEYDGKFEQNVQDAITQKALFTEGANIDDITGTSCVTNFDISRLIPTWVIREKNEMVASGQPNVVSVPPSIEEPVVLVEEPVVEEPVPESVVKSVEEPIVAENVKQEPSSVADALNLIADKIATAVVNKMREKQIELYNQFMDEGDIKL